MDAKASCSAGEVLNHPSHILCLANRFELESTWDECLLLTFGSKPPILRDTQTEAWVASFQRCWSGAWRRGWWQSQRIPKTPSSYGEYRNHCSVAVKRYHDHGSSSEGKHLTGTGLQFRG